MKNKQSVFICHSWLGIGVGDGQTDRIFTAAKGIAVRGVETLFLANASNGIADDHIWLSVLMKPTRNPFTRCQRASCCLLTVLCTMLANIMFYRKDILVRTTETRILVGVLSALAPLPVHFGMITLFRKFSTHHFEAKSKLLTVAKQKKNGRKTDVSNSQPQIKIQFSEYVESNETTCIDETQTNLQNGADFLSVPANLKTCLSTRTIELAELLNKDENTSPETESCTQNKDFLVTKTKSVRFTDEEDSEAVSQPSIIFDINKDVNTNGKHSN